MSKKANPTLIGAFVLVALAITIMAIVVLGQVKLRDDRFRCVAYFTGSLYGLDVGAPVTFRGVNIGRVSAVRINYDREQNNYLIPVAIDIEKATNLSGIRAEQWDPNTVRATLDQMIEKGLRAQLKITSFLTGKLYIDLALYPEHPATFRGSDQKVFEIPTMPSGLEQITQKLESLPLAEILNKAAVALDGINSLLNAESTQKALSSAGVALDRLNSLLTNADKELPQLIAELKKSLAKISQAADSAGKLLVKADRELPALKGEISTLLSGLTKASATLGKTLSNLQQLTDQDSRVVYQVEATLREVERAAASVREITDYLQQNPNALVFGPKE
nr:MlaD family protein [uncultured Desulfobulbus sp.]